MLLVSVALLGSSCAVLKVNPAVYTKQKFALASFYGPKQIQGSVGLVGAIQGGSTEWGAELFSTEYPGWESSLKQTLGGEWLPLGKVALAPSYTGLDGAAFEEHQATPAGLRALDTGLNNDARLGKLATELGVDAVVLVRHQWMVMSDRDAPQHGYDAFSLVVVGADGVRLWDERDNLDGPQATRSSAGLLAQMGGAMVPDDVKEMIRGTVLLAHDGFARRWKSSRP